MNRASLCALTATVAKRIIDHGKIVGNLDGTVGTNLLTLHTSDTTVGAVLASLRPLFPVGALHYHAGGIVGQMYNALGALTHTNTATDTLGVVDLCHSVVYGDRLLRANRSTVAAAKTSIGAKLIALIGRIEGMAGLLTLIVVL